MQEPVEPQIIDSGLPAAGLVAHTLVSRFVDHLPYYRQEAINARSNVHTPRSTGLTGRVLHARAQRQRQRQAEPVRAEAGRQRAVAIHARIGPETDPYPGSTAYAFLVGAAVVHREGVNIKGQPPTRQHAIVGPLAGQQCLGHRRCKSNISPARASMRWRSVGIDGSRLMPSACL